VRETGRTSTSLRVLIVVAMGGTAALMGTSVSTADPQPTIAEVRAKVEELHEQAAEATERYNLGLEEEETIERRLTKAEAAVDRQEALINQLLTELGGFAAAAYRSGGTDPALNAMFADDPTQFLNQASIADAFVLQQADRLMSIEVERQDLEQKRLVVDEELSRSEAVTAMLEQDKSAIDELLVEQQKLLDRLTAAQRAALERQRAREREEVQAARQEASTRLSRSDGSERAAVAVAAALSKVGSPYVYGGKGPDVFDCSGFTSWAWAKAGVSLSPASRSQIHQGQPVAANALQPGDLLFYDTPISHVAMYIGNGEVVHAANPRSGVTIAPAMQAGGSAKPFVGAVRPG
jgi:cell wall-associated NlpC family hydrolase